MYSLLLDFARRTWPALSIIDDLDDEPFSGLAATFMANRSAFKIPFITKGGVRYGSLADKRTEADEYACVDFDNSRIPCRLLYHFELHIGTKDPVICSIVERMCADDKIPVFPWSL